MRASARRRATSASARSRSARCPPDVTSSSRRSKPWACCPTAAEQFAVFYSARTCRGFTATTAPPGGRRARELERPSQQLIRLHHLAQPRLEAAVAAVAIGVILAGPVGIARRSAVRSASWPSPMTSKARRCSGETTNRRRAPRSPPTDRRSRPSAAVGRYLRWRHARTSRSHPASGCWAARISSALIPRTSRSRR